MPLGISGFVSFFPPFSNFAVNRFHHLLLLILTNQPGDVAVDSNRIINKRGLDGQPCGMLANSQLLSLLTQIVFGFHINPSWELTRWTCFREELVRILIFAETVLREKLVSTVNSCLAGNQEQDVLYCHRRYVSYTSHDS